MVRPSPFWEGKVENQKLNESVQISQTVPYSLKQQALRIILLHVDQYTNFAHLSILLLQQELISQAQHLITIIMSEEAGNGTPNVPRFTFGSMALGEEPGRGGAGSQSAGGLAGESSVHGADNGDAITSSDTIDMLRAIVLNEQFSPEILQFEKQVVDSVRNLVETQTELVDAEEDDDQVDQISFESQLKRMELDRINYQLRQYYRLRIKKIEKFIMYIFKGEGPFDLLSKEEQEFAVSYSDLVEEHFKKSFLSLLPPRLQIMEKDGEVDHATPPPLDRFVFCRVRNNIGQYVIGEDANDDSLELNRGDIVCIRYKSIRDLLKNGDVELL